MQPAPIGTRIRIIRNSNAHHYVIGAIYTVSRVDDSDGTLKATSKDGREGDWLRWGDCRPAVAISWEFCRTVLPAEVIRLLDCFAGIEDITLKEEVKDRILRSLPDLHQVILRHADPGPESPGVEVATAPAQTVTP